MAGKRYSLLHSTVQRLAATRPGGWFFARTLHHFDALSLKLTSGRATLTGFLAGLPVVVLTTLGAKSGLPRTLPLVCIHDPHTPGAFAVIASNYGQRHHPAWYFNLKARPRATCSLRGRQGEYAAHEASGEEYERFWQCAVDTYLGYPLYRQRAGNRRIPIVVMTPLTQ